MHSHTHRTDRADRLAESWRSLQVCLVLTSVYMLAEVLGGFFFNSLALVADAGHMFTDSAALALTMFAFRFSSRPATPQKTFGYYRMEILAALINGIALVLISLYIFYEAWHRWNNPPAVKGLGLTLVASGGLLINVFCAWLLHSDREHNLNIRSAWLHIVSDIFGSIAAIAAGVLILMFQWFWADAVCSALIAVIIIYSAWNLISESVNILLEGAPAHINLAAVEQAILQTEGVLSLHDLHIWSIASGLEALSAHVQQDQNFSQPEILRLLRTRLHDEFGIDHLTIQLETSEFKDDELHLCDVGANCFQTQSSPAAKIN